MAPSVRLRRAASAWQRILLEFRIANGFDFNFNFQFRIAAM
jgi:hypothetical protein